MKKISRLEILQWLLRGISFFCGIFVFFFMEATSVRSFSIGLAALIIGILLFKLSLGLKTPLNGIACWVIAYCLFLFVVILGSVILGPTGGVCHCTWPDRERAVCESCLRHIFNALQMYSCDNNGYFPPTVEAFVSLYPEYIWDPGSFWSYGDYNNSKPLDITTSELDVPNSAQISYTYFPGFSKKSDPDSIILKDNSPENHLGIGVNVLYVAGSVEFIEEPGKSWNRTILERNFLYFLQYHPGKLIIYLLTLVTTIHWIVLRSKTIKKKSE